MTKTANIENSFKTHKQDLNNHLAKYVLLIGRDSVDMIIIKPLVEKGLIPNMAKFVNAVVMGNTALLTPMLSPILWTSVTMGKHADVRLKYL